MELKQYIISRVDRLKCQNLYNTGYHSKAEIVYGLKELEMLATEFKIDIFPASFRIQDFIK